MTLLRSIPSVQPAEGWKASDGVIFSDKHIANFYQAKLNIILWVKESGIGTGGVWDEEDIASKITNNAEELETLLNQYNLAIHNKRLAQTSRGVPD